VILSGWKRCVKLRRRDSSDVDCLRKGFFRDFCGLAAFSSSANKGRKPEILNKFI
jgi:hypothetical protein